MRDKINSDPRYQIGAIAILLVIGVFFFISKSGGGEEGEATTEATVAVAGTEATATATGATAGEAVESAVEGAVENAAAEASTAATVVPSAIEAPPPPVPVTAAYKADKTVVLLIVHDGGIDDALVAKSVHALSSLSDVAVFVVPASQIFRYASIALGVEVSRVPALVVMRPRNLSEGTPQATVTFGFRSTESVIQAVRDASYDGPAETYHPN